MNKVQFLHETEDMQLTCAHCHDRLVKPVQTKNGHRFCEDCFLKKRTSDKTCKRCVEDDIKPMEDCNRLGLKDCFGDKAVVFDMYKMKAKCITCRRRGTYREIMKLHERDGCKKPCCPCVLQ
ncbi:TNF receptor-associated factor 3-like [Mercenaria mercenaria]|uniref:TNF receptor-associated factor 3-like n=1 Tax=Mercenaria mercenaria TaxID=6596 RepID=UPI00234EEB2B|nr:TNF receptor-associated factor 3-like [Mercenaria mercenaria]